MLGVALGSSSPSMTSWNRSGSGMARRSVTVAAVSWGAALAIGHTIAGGRRADAAPLALRARQDRRTALPKAAGAGQVVDGLVDQARPVSVERRLQLALEQPG